MDYVRLGTTGLEVSPLCLGLMTYGDPNRGNHAWTLPEEQARPFFSAAVDAGVNFFDTADVYSDGRARRSPDARSRELTRATNWSSPRRCSSRCGPVRTARLSRKGS